jgi:Carboxypeptidase regulatory-like domain
MTVQKSIVGHVYDAQGRAAANAIVMVSGSTAAVTDIASSADETGQFYLDNLSLPGVYTLQINYQGNLVKRTVTLTETDSAVTIQL